MKVKIGIFGSSAFNSNEILLKAKSLGSALGTYDVILITGACTGLPYAVVSQAFQSNKKIEIWGYSPAFDLNEQIYLTKPDDNSIYKKLIYVPHEFPSHSISVRRKYRNVLSTAECDAGIIVSGKWGTMNEFTNLFDMGKVIGVYIGTEGIADMLKSWNRRINKSSKAVIIYESDPEMLVKKVIAEVIKRRNL